MPELPLSLAIRSALRAIHDRIEATPIANHMVAGTLDRDTYARLLVSMLAIHRALEAACERCGLPADIAGPHIVRSTAIERDLAALASGAEPEAFPGTDAAVDGVRAAAAIGAPALAGHIYVSEGSRMGSLVVGPRLATGLQVPCESGVGLDYHLEDAQLAPLRFRRFCATLDAAPWDAAQRRAAIDGAVAAMTDLLAIYAAASVATPEAVR